MARFHIHLYEGSDVVLDDHGREFPTIDHATDHAIAGGAAIMADILRSGVKSVALELIVEDKGSALRRSIPMTATVGSF